MAYIHVDLVCDFNGQFRYQHLEHAGQGGIANEGEVKLVEMVSASVVWRERA